MITPADQLAGRRLEPGQRFCFRCHPGLSCFNSCCRAKRLQLTPYDVLRLRRALGLSSVELLASQLELELEPETGWPLLRIRLREDGRCPFLGASGCGVYDHRPTCCRVYPLARATRLTGGELEEIFLVEETCGCLGWSEPRQLLVEDWIAEQGLADYFSANRSYMELLMRRPRGGLSERQVHAVILGLFNLDLFRQALPSLAGLLCLQPASIEEADRSDEALLGLGLRWVVAELGLPAGDLSSATL